MNKHFLFYLFLLISVSVFSQKIKKQSAKLDESASLRASIYAKAETIEQKVIAWRRDIHQFPELSNREFKTAEKVATHLKSLGIEVQTGVAKTGVVGLLKGALPGPVVALRADMDALPVKERADITFASKATGEYNGAPVSIMHACGHDTHVAILMGVAEVLASHKNELKGTVKFIFQPAEEGAPTGEEGGADLMVKEGVLENPKVDVIFGLHINAQTHVGEIKYKPHGTMAASDWFTIKVKGKQTHGAYPFLGIDPIVTGSQIVMGLQTIVSRNLNLGLNGAVVTVGKFDAGVRSNIIPEEITLSGTIRTLDTESQSIIHKRMREIATNIAESAGATAEVEIKNMTPVTYNDEPLVNKMVPTLQHAAGIDQVKLTAAVFGAEDFAFFQEKVPGFFFFLGGAPKGIDLAKTAAHHTPDFFIDEGGFTLGVKALSMMVVNYSK